MTDSFEKPPHSVGCFICRPEDPAFADVEGCVACEVDFGEFVRACERRFHHDLGREIAWEIEVGKMDSSYIDGLMSRVRAGDAFTRDGEWPEWPS